MRSNKKDNDDETDKNNKEIENHIHTPQVASTYVSWISMSVYTLVCVFLLLCVKNCVCKYVSSKSCVYLRKFTCAIYIYIYIYIYIRGHIYTYVCIDGNSRMPYIYIYIYIHMCEYKYQSM